MEKYATNLGSRLAERVRAAALELITESVAFTDASGRVRYVNGAFVTLHRIEPDAMIGRHTSELAANDESALQYAAMDAARAAGLGWTGDVVDRLGVGSTIELRLSASAVRDETGRLIGWIEVGKDVAAERGLEAQLRHAVKMEAIGRLASSVAHDFNNLLTAIRGFADLHRGAHEEEGEQTSDLDEILKATDSAAALVRRLLAVGRQSGARPVPLDVPTVAHAVEPLLRQLVGEDVAVRVTAEDVPKVLAVPGHIEEILLNLAANARDAMPSGGTLTIAVSSLEIGSGVAPRAQSHSANPVGAPVRPGTYVEVRAVDDGVGMDEDTIGHIFEPFFTTKEPGKGTGLGLASVLGIVQQANGFVDVRSEVGRGTTFRIFLPATIERPRDLGVRRAACRHDGGHGQVLLVEDDPSVLAFAVRALERHGYQVRGFADPCAALEHARSARPSVDCLVTDVAMPGLDGRALVRRISEVLPGIAALYMSGREWCDAGPLPSPSHIAKPFTGCELADAVRHVLAANVDRPKGRPLRLKLPVASVASPRAADATPLRPSTPRPH